MSPQGLRDLAKKFKDTGFTCDKSRSGRPTDSEKVVTEVNHTVISGYMQLRKAGVVRWIYQTQLS